MYRIWYKSLCVFFFYKCYLLKQLKIYIPNGQYSSVLSFDEVQSTKIPHKHGQPLPRQPLSRIIDKRAIRRGIQSLQSRQQFGQRWLHFERRLRSAHVRFDPAGMNGNAEHVVTLEFDAHRFGGGVQGGLLS